LDDEVQYRCAGFIQAEIERYADFLDDNHEEEAASQPSEDGSGQENDVGDNPIKTRKTRRSKKVHTGGAFLHFSHEFGPYRCCNFVAVLNARDVLEKEYIFIDVISTFLRAIRTGAIHIQHGAVVLAHYGRLEVAFDACCKIVVDILREETVMKEKPDFIVSVVTKAVQEVCDVDTG
jgi:cohesin complex subunit SA-1/2